MHKLLKHNKTISNFTYQQVHIITTYPLYLSPEQYESTIYELIKKI